MRTLYKKQQDELVALLKKHLSAHLEVDACDTGMHLVAWMLQPCDTQMLAKKAFREGIVFQSIADSSVHFKQRDGLMMGFTGFNAADMELGVMKLKQLLKQEAVKK